MAAPSLSRLPVVGLSERKGIAVKKLMFLFLAAGMAVAAFAEGQTGDRHFENAGNFSICPPAGWNVYGLPGIKYKIFHDSPYGGFSPNIVFVDESYEGTLAEYVGLNNRNMEAMFPGTEIFDPVAFTTDSGLNGMKQVTLSAQSGTLLRQVYYYFSNGSAKMVITCSAPDSAGQKYERIFDGSARTFEFTGR